MFADLSSFLKAFAVDDEQAISAYGLGNVGMNLLGYPPIHQHHFHFGHNFNDLMSNHGDGQCVADEGGAACLIKTNVS